MSKIVVTQPLRYTLGRMLIRQLLLFSVVLLVSVIALAVFGYFDTSYWVKNTLETANMQTQYVFDTLFAESIADLRATGQTWVDVEDYAPGLRRLLARHPSFFEALVISPVGKVLGERRQVGGVVEQGSGQPWLGEVSAGGTYIGPVSYKKYGVPFVDIAVPVNDADGGLAATLLVRVDLSSFSSEIARQWVGKHGLVYVTDDEGKILIHSQLDMRAQTWNLSTFIGKRPHDLAAEDITLARGTMGKYVFIESTPLQTVNWHVIVELPVEEALRPAFTWLLLPLVLFILTLLVTPWMLRFAQERIMRPLHLLNEGAAALGKGQLEYRIRGLADDELGMLGQAFNAMADQLQEVFGRLEQRVQERTGRLLAGTEVSRATTSILDPAELLRVTVELVRERFDLYYVGLFLIDESREFAVLRAGTGQAGAEMLARDHKLAVGGVSMIGQCVSTGQARIALDVGDEPHRFSNPLLPHTRSEMALPLRSRGRIVGAMTVQSVAEAAFDDTDIAVMQTMADQVAVAIDNARLFSETQAALVEMRAAQRRYLGEGWADFLEQHAVHGYRVSSDGVTPLDEAALPETQAVLHHQQSRTVVREAGESNMLLLQLRQLEQTIGVLGVENKQGDLLWSADEVAFVQAIGDQFSQAAELLRLLNSSQTLAARERINSQVTASMRTSLNVEDVLQTAVREIGERLNVEVEGWLGIAAVQSVMPSAASPMRASADNTGATVDSAPEPSDDLE